MTPYRLYLTGPMTGLPDFNHPAFHQAADQLRAAGYIVTNPADNGRNPDDPWLEHMRTDIILMMQRRCNGIATLPGIGQSQGSLVEIRLGKGLGLPVMTVAEWLHMANPADRVPAAQGATA